MANPLRRIARFLWLCVAIGALGDHASTAAQEAVPPVVAPVAPTGAEAQRAIDWMSVQPLSPIPRLMPAGDSDDPLEAGFSPEWIKHSLGPGAGLAIATGPGRAASARADSLALQIIAKKRDPQDRWAHGVADKLRETIRGSANFSSLAAWRVFCGPRGCLCYFEYVVPYVFPAALDARAGVYVTLRKELLDADGWGAQFAIEPFEVFEIPVAPHGNDVWWGLIYIVRPEP